jgi:hypothetical protein
MKEAPVRRVVTGHDGHGRAVIQEDGPVPRVQRVGGDHGPLFFEVWSTQATPAPIDHASGEPPETGIQLAPPKHGTRIRVLDIPPDDPSFQTLTSEQIQAHFAEVGAAGPLRMEGRAHVMPLCIAPKPSTMASSSKGS